MNSKKSATKNIDDLTEDAKSLLAATADVAEEKVVQARKRLAKALEQGREAFSYVQDRASEGAQATDEMIREHPYQALGVAFGAGVLVGFLISRR